LSTTILDVDLSLFVRVPQHAHVIATEFGNTRQPVHASFDKQDLRRCGCQCASRIRAVLSDYAETMRVPSLKAAEATEDSCLKTLISFPAAAPRLRAVVSKDPLTMRILSGLKAAE
jgi:hypothetical protein